MIQSPQRWHQPASPTDPCHCCGASLCPSYLPLPLGIPLVHGQRFLTCLLWEIPSSPCSLRSPSSCGSYLIKDCAHNLVTFPEKLLTPDPGWVWGHRAKPSWLFLRTDRYFQSTCLVSLIPSPKKYVLLWLWFWERGDEAEPAQVKSQVPPQVIRIQSWSLSPLLVHGPCLWRGLPASVDSPPPQSYVLKKARQSLKSSRQLNAFGYKWQKTQLSPALDKLRVSDSSSTV